METVLPLIFFAVSTLVATTLAYARGFANGEAAAKAAVDNPVVAGCRVDERPPEHRPVPGSNLSPASEAVAEAQKKPSEPFPFQVGDRFTFLGLTMLCIKQTREGETLNPGSLMQTRAQWDAIVAEYVDANGRIRSWVSTRREWPALLCEAERVGIRAGQAADWSAA